MARWWRPRTDYIAAHASHGGHSIGGIDAHFFQCAHPDLIASPFLRGDEHIVLQGLLPERTEMRLPGWQVVVVIETDGNISKVCLPSLDTVRIELDSRRLTLVWRAHFDRHDPVRELSIGLTKLAISQ
nr:DUF2169 domain-containing protein [Chitinimonas arctica]